jgi:uncharacterized peroxidase-related enzyme
MTRVGTIDAAALPDADREVYERADEYGSFRGLVGTMANRPPIMRNVWNMLLELKAEGVLPQRYLELALVTASRLNECTYCVSHHTPHLKVAGVAEDTALNILDYKNLPELDEVDRLVCEYSIEVTTNWNRVRDGLISRLKQHFSDEQLVELTWRIALCGAFNRFNDVLQIDMEDGVQEIPLISAESQ